MKSFLSIVFTAISLSLCAQNVSVSGKITNYSGSDSLKLIFLTDNNAQPVSLTVDDKGEFAYTQKLKKPEFAQIYFNRNDAIILVLAPGEKVKLHADYVGFGQNYTVTGSKESEQWQHNVQKTQAYTQELAVKRAEVEELEQKRMNELVSFINHNATSLTTLGLINMVNIEEYPDVYENLATQLHLTYPDNFLVQDFYKQVSARFFLKEGSVIPDIKLSDKNGKIVALSSLRGKVVLLDFWASWCGPCRAEIPNIKQAYSTYHSKGFDVYSVSIDRTKDAWLQALTALNMPWTNVFDASQEYASQFGVSSIPFTILIDQQGKIIAKNVRGGALEQYLSQLLK
ncbi:MAG: AhpC/TSA family protein [Bacteroidales bacterium]|jgi:peroxiredoxin|nr:AhpC/TSA family protein [Bacteroidales bacterium]